MASFRCYSLVASAQSWNTCCDGKVAFVPKTVLEEKVYGIDEELESNAVPVHVHHLRRKLQDAKATAEIHTVRGIGYLLAEIKR